MVGPVDNTPQLHVVLDRGYIMKTDPEHIGLKDAQWSPKSLDDMDIAAVVSLVECLIWLLTETSLGGSGSIQHVCR